MSEASWTAQSVNNQLVSFQVGYCSVSCQKLHWQTHKKFCKQLAKDYEKQLVAKLEAEKLQEIDKTEKDKPVEVNGENKCVLNGKDDQSMNCQKTATKDEDTTTAQLHDDNREIKHEPTGT